MSASIVSLAAFAALLFCQADPAAAQAPSRAQRGNPAASAQAQRLWDRYRDKPGQADSEEALLKIGSSRALPAIRENATAMLALLKSSVSRDEKVQLIRLAGAQVLDLRDEQAGRDLRRHISEVAMTSEDPVLAKAAALTYSRMGWYPDSLDVLARARAKGYIHDDDYFGDLAHLLPAAPSAIDQSRILKLLAAGGNSHSRDILASLFVDRQILKALAPASIVDALGVLAENAPTFSSSTTTISGVDAIRYGDWMNAVVGLNAQASGELEHIVMARLLKIDGANPKALIAVLIHEPNAALVRAGIDRRSLDKIDTAIAGFAEQSRNAWVQELAGLARSNLVQPRSQPLRRATQ